MLKQEDGAIDELYDHENLGNTAEKAEPRCSITKDVLGWELPAVN
ncbi:hypothetical protein [Stratiformator vulcanicus]|nr:hypothetical protein [Stratiformator vulcanicus]